MQSQQAPPFVSWETLLIGVIEDACLLRVYRSRLRGFVSPRARGYEGDLVAFGDTPEMRGRLTAITKQVINAPAIVTVRAASSPMKRAALAG